MSYCNIFFNQILDLLPRHQSESLLNKYQSDGYVKYFSCWQHFITPLYTQIRAKDTVRWTIKKGLLLNYTIKMLVFLTNNFILSAYTITQTFEARCNIETLFRWIYQNLGIKSFHGTFRNAVLAQLRVAMCCHRLVFHIKYQTGYSFTLSEFAIMPKENVLKRTSLIDLLSGTNYTC